MLGLGILEIWNFGIVRPQKFGNLEFWNFGSVRPQKFGNLEFWKFGNLVLGTKNLEIWNICTH